MQEHILDTIDPKVLGRRLQEARKARGLTQQDVAKELGLARTTVTAIEKGDRSVQPEELLQLARLYGRGVSELVRRREVVEEFAVQFRAALAEAVDHQAELQQAIHEFQRLCEDYLELEELCESPLTRAYPPQYSMAGISPEDAAEDIAWAERNRLGLGDGPIVSPREILENDVGLRIFYPKLPSRVAGMFAYTEKLGGCIAINSAHPAERRRWSLAHEYSHFLTSRFRPEVSVMLVYERLPASERFADAFAGVFLVPANGLRRRFHELSRLRKGKITPAELCRLAHYYVVSLEALTRRLETLRLLPIGTWDRLRGSGFKVREAQTILGLQPHPQADHLLPLRYQYLAVEAYQRGDLTEGQLARFLRADRLEARRLVHALTHHPDVSEEGKVATMAVNLDQSLSGNHE
ncbi:MAG: ImmA/IrrE family metallo-endopeptidase [Nitrospinae bacterium]|nr:ImmA/IrrE family metallo-endopeptidase [Nitrospinota bacterium]